MPAIPAGTQTDRPETVSFRPYALLAELTYRCPLHCPYCSNPTTVSSAGELSFEEWVRVIRESAALGVMQTGFSGGEPLAFARTPELVAEARTSGLYTNLLTSGIGLDQKKMAALAEAGLDSLQLSFQADDPALADSIAGIKAHGRKIAAAKLVRETGVLLGLNVVLHRANIDRLDRIIALAETVGAERLELANVQYYGWAFQNAKSLLPTRPQVERAMDMALAEKERLRGKMEIFYVLPDYYQSRPKPCLHGWGRRYITVNPVGEALPCPTAGAIPGLRFDSIRDHSLSWIWNESESFNRFRGSEWMPEPCRSCPQKELDFGGCRCQAALLTGDGAVTDPVCEFSPDRNKIDETLTAIQNEPAGNAWVMRRNPNIPETAPA